jgi:hypothetical protein
MACLFAVVITTDGFACPDGCTDEAPGLASSTHASPSCAICQGCSHRAMVLASRPALRPVMRDALVVTSPSEPALTTPELPPKAA